MRPPRSARPHSCGLKRSSPPTKTRFGQNVPLAGGRGDHHARNPDHPRGLLRHPARRDRPQQLRNRHPHAAGPDPLDDRHQRNGHRHRRHGRAPARHGPDASQRHDQRRGDEQPRLALDVLVRHPRPRLGRGKHSGAARRRHLDQRHGSLRRSGQHVDRRPANRIRRRRVALLRLVQHQQAGRAHLLGPDGRPLDPRRAADAHRLGRLHRPRSHGPQILHVPGRLLQRQHDAQADFVRRQGQNGTHLHGRDERGDASQRPEVPHRGHVLHLERTALLLLYEGRRAAARHGRLLRRSDGQLPANQQPAGALPPFQREVDPQRHGILHLWLRLLQAVQGRTHALRIPQYPDRRRCRKGGRPRPREDHAQPPRRSERLGGLLGAEARPRLRRFVQLLLLPPLGRARLGGRSAAAGTTTTWTSTTPTSSLAPTGPWPKG